MRLRQSDFAVISVCVGAILGACSTPGTLGDSGSDSETLDGMVHEDSVLVDGRDVRDARLSDVAMESTIGEAGIEADADVDAGANDGMDAGAVEDAQSADGVTPDVMDGSIQGQDGSVEDTSMMDSEGMDVPDMGVVADSAVMMLADVGQDAVVETGTDVGPTRHHILGTLRGLTAGTIVLRNNGGDELSLRSDGEFRFPTALLNGSMFAVTIEARPAMHQCAVTSGGTGTVMGADVTSVLIDCAVSSSRTFAFTMVEQNFEVPAGVTELGIEAWGAQGASNENEDAAGGAGGYAAGVVTVVPRSIVTVLVGGQNGWNGGGSGGRAPGFMAVRCRAAGGSGGGASDVRIGGVGAMNRVLVAGGGGGAGGGLSQLCTDNGFAGATGGGGGGGGGLFGGGGGAAFEAGNPVFPTGGTQVAGGFGGYGAANFDVSRLGGPGQLGQGGHGASAVLFISRASRMGANGGGGGGEVGGDGFGVAGPSAQSGAGGSSYIGGVRNGVTRAGVRSFDGEVILRW